MCVCAQRKEKCAYDLITSINLDFVTQTEEEIHTDFSERWWYSLPEGGVRQEERKCWGRAAYFRAG